MACTRRTRHIRRYRMLNPMRETVQCPSCNGKIEYLGFNQYACEYYGGDCTYEPQTETTLRQHLANIAVNERNLEMVLAQQPPTECNGDYLPYEPAI
jgi:hypothetical protein